MLITVTLAAGQTTEYAEENDFFRFLEGTGLVSLIFYFNGKEISRAEKVKEGYAEKFLTERFNKVLIKNESTTAQTIQFVGRLGHEVEYNKTPVGDVNVKNTSLDVKVVSVSNIGALQRSVINLAEQISFVNGTQTTRIAEISPAKNRKYFCIKNIGTVGQFIVLLDDTLTNGANGFPVNAGQTLTFGEFSPSSKVRIFGDGAASIELIEGV